MYLVGYLYEDYHDARSLEHKVLELEFIILNISKTHQFIRNFHKSLE
jgi:hypothetical protein